MKKSTKIIIGFVAFLVAIRIALPFYIKDYVNKVLKDIDGYEGSIDGVGLSLIRGAYQIEGLELFSVEKDIKTPFVKIETIDISLEWKALLNGAIVGEIILQKPELNFAASADEGVQSGEENDWTETITDLLPLQINRFEIVNGKVSYIDEFADPKVNLYFNQLNALATNLNNATSSSDELPSHITANSKTIGKGKFSAEMDINILKKVPDFDLNLSIEEVNIPSLNDFFKAYANVDAESGGFSFYTEVALIDKQLDGYFKPLTDDLRILKWKEEEEKFWGKAWEALVGLAGNLLENPRKNQIGTKVPVSGKIEETNIGTWKAIFRLFKNAYFKPLQRQIDQTIEVKQKTIINTED